MGKDSPGLQAVISLTCFVTLDALQCPRFKRKLEVLFGEHIKFTIKGENVSLSTENT